MPTNNRTTTYYDTNMSKVRRANKNKEAAKRVQDNRYEAVKEDIKRTAQIILGEKEFVKESNFMVVNKKPWERSTPKGNINPITNKLLNIEQDFFNVVAGKSHNPEQFLKLTIENLNITMANQKDNANESLTSWFNAIDYFKTNVENQGKVIAWDLETTGAKNLNGIWHPDSITEFSMQEYDYATGKITKNDILVGLEKEEGKKVFEEIKLAIQNGTIENNERLRVSAMRYAKYGDEDFAMKFLEDKGYFTATNFPNTTKHNWKDLDVIGRGIDRLVEAGTDSRIIGADGLRNDKKAVMMAVNNANKLLSKGNTVLAGFNDSKFDKPILESIMLNWANQDERYKSLFDNNQVGLFVNSNQWLDVFGGTKLFTDYNSINSLYPGADISDIEKVRGQEFIAQKHYAKRFKKMGYKPHMAGDDVSVLLDFITQPSELANNNQTFLDFITKGVETKADYKEHILTPGQQVLRAKKGVGGVIGGRNYLNFAHSKSTGEIFTADNHVIHNGKIENRNYSAGYGVTKGDLLDIISINKFNLNDELRSSLGEISPEYSGSELYRVQLGSVVHDKYKNTRQGDLIQNLIFKNEKEMQAFLAGNFDVVAERLDNGEIKIVEEMERYFDRRVLDSKNGKASFQQVTKKPLTDTEKFQMQVLANNEKKAVSRADNAMFKDGSYNKINKALNVKTRLEEFLKVDNIGGQDILAIMSGKVAKGQMPIELSNEQIMSSQEIIAKALGYDANNIEKILRSTIDNTSFGVDMISTHEKMLTNVMNSLDSLEGFKQQSAGYKQELFSRVVKEVKHRAAEHVYDDIKTQNRMMLGNKQLESTYQELKNTYEIDYSKLLKGDKINFIGISNPEEYANILKLDLSNEGAMFNLINKSTEIVHGKEFLKQDIYQKDSIAKMFDLLNQDSDLNKTTSFKNIKKQFGFKNGKFTAPIQQHVIAEGIVSGMRELKTRNATNGFINIDQAFMKALDGNPGFGAILNSDGIVNQISSIVDEVSSNFKYTELGSKEDITALAKNLVSKHYMPDINAVRKGVNYNDTVEILYKNANQEMTEYMSNILESVTRIKGTSLSIQDDGTLVASRAGEIFNLDNIPRVQLDDTSGVMYIQLGSMKLQLNNELTFKTKGSKVHGGTRSSLGFLNDYNISSTVKSALNQDGEEAAFDALTYGINSRNKKLRQRPTINSFGGNDVDSNHFIDVSGIKDVIVDMFGEGGTLNHYVDNVNFADKELVKTLKDDLAYLVKSEQKIDELNPELSRNLIKNMEHILDIVRDYGSNGAITEDFFTLSQGIGFTGSEKRASKMVGVRGYRPTNSTLGIFDNTQRPPITQSGNSFQLRVDDILDATKTKNMNVGVGNVITTSNMDNRLLREYSGIGRTTTDVMMNISYMDTNSLDIILNNNYEKVINENSVDINTKKQLNKAFEFIKNTVNTFEQERAMDSRIHEAVYGLRTAQTQKLSKNYDIVSVLDNLQGSDYEKQAAAILDQRGSFSFVDGELTYKASHGRLLNKGESAIKWKGFADLESSFASKMNTGIFNYNYYESDGTKLRTSDINRIIKENKDAFKNKTTQAEMVRTLEDLLSKKNIKGQYAIEDISAIGYVKTMTGGAEKGMTNIVYAATGSYDPKVKKFFEQTGYWNTVKSRVITEEATDAFFYKNLKTSQKALEVAGFDSLDALKKAMEVERHTHSEVLFSKILNGKTHVIANDALAKHGNIGQMYQGTLSKAIDSLSKKMGNQNNAVQYIVDLVNSNSDYQFITNADLTKGFSVNDLKAIGLKNINGRLQIDNNFKASTDTISTLNADRFKNLIRTIDSQLTGMAQSDRLITKDVYVADDKGNYEKHDEFFGSFNYATKDINVNGTTVPNAKVIMYSNSRENLKYVRDAETQTNVNAEYFELKKTSRALKKRKIALEAELANAKGNQKDVLRMELIGVKSQLADINENIAAYSGAVKTMTLGDQELAVLERMTITEAHANKINELIESGEVNKDTFLNSVAFQGKVTVGKNGELEFSDDFLGKKMLGGLTSQIRQNQFYDSYSEDLLTEDMLNSKAHLKEFFDYAKKHDMKLGEESAEKLYQAKLADKASLYNKGKLAGGQKELLEAHDGFTIKDINGVHFNVDNVAEENLLVDLGEEFGAKRFMAMPGIGMSVGDKEIRIEAQNKLIALQHRVADIRNLAGSDKEKEGELIEKALVARDEAITSLNKTIYGKNGLMHNYSKIELDAVSYRLKASGIITNNYTDEMIEAAKKANLSLTDSATYTKKSVINGKTISEWEKDGEAFYRYKYVSRDRFDDMGYFKDDTLKQYGFLKEGVSKEEAITQMEDFLETHGTYDISDRYPNTRNESLSANRIFLGRDLTQNKTKVSLPTMLGANADHDGDSYSSFRIELKDEDGKRYDGGLYELAKMRAKSENIGPDGVRQFAIDSGIMPGEIYDQFAHLEAGMTAQATTFTNKNWTAEGMSTILKDYAKNQNISNPDNMVLVPGGKSILGEHAFANLSSMPKLEEFNRIEGAANDILIKANEIIDAKNLGIDKLSEDVSSGSSAKMLDEALDIIGKHGDLSQKEFGKLQATAIQRATVDRYAQETMAKTGLAATGSVNLALNSAKLASYYADTDAKDFAMSNYVWSVLDTAEQGVISSKKDSTAGYNDTRIKDFKNAMKNIFNGKSTTTADSAIAGLGDWLEEHGNGIFKASYENMGHMILSSEQLESLKQYSGDEKIAKGTEMMKNKFLGQIREMSNDKVTISYVAAFDSMGRNGKHVGDVWGDGSIGIAAELGNSLGSRTQGMMGYGDKAQLDAYYAQRAQEVEASSAAAIAKQKLSSSANAKQAVNAAVEGYAGSTVAKTSRVGGLGMAMLGVAAGLMIGGYASGNPLNDKSAEEHSNDMVQPQQTMSIPDFMEKESGYVTGNSQQGYIINIRADTKKGRKHMQKMMSKAAEATVGGAVSVNMNIKNSSNQGITDRDIENFINRYM